ncbi:MAG: ACP S-malonyltransferase [Bacteroidales bacterium]|nr:ACP S-malonyltransferase [Bacteroidales bacterium]MDY6348605.1 ACP S-malonyltransferase [Bacteroidales bacterium]
MKGFVFPGQGSQRTGMGKALFDNYEEAKGLFSKADDILGFSISKIMFEGDEEQLKQTKYTQLAMFMHGFVSYRCLASSLPDMVAGHSLGEYTALAAAGALSFEDALLLVEKRASAMQKACERQESGMAAVLKFDKDMIKEICSAIKDEVVVPANYNSPQQTVISGSLKGLETAYERLREAGASRIMPLNVSGAFHSPLMQPAQDELAEAINNCNFSTPICPVYQNVTAEPTTDPETIRANLVLQLTSPVRWTETVENMVRDGADSFAEYGPSVLKSLIKRIVPDVATENSGDGM